jgi:hypothetical protein
MRCYKSYIIAVIIFIYDYIRAGNLPSVKHNFTLVVVGIVIVSVLPVVYEIYKVYIYIYYMYVIMYLM